MGRFTSDAGGGGATALAVSSAGRLTGVFGTGQVRMFAASTTFVVPDGVEKVRARAWGGGGGGGGSAGGSGGGFSMKEIAVTPGASIPITVGNGGSGSGGASSFGVFITAEGGGSNGAAPGGGIGGDVNYTGGYSDVGGGGGAASVFGQVAGSGGSYSTTATARDGNPGLTGSAGLASRYFSGSGVFYMPPTPPNGDHLASLDFIGTGPGGAGYTEAGDAQSGVNGGGGGAGGSGHGGFPGGGGGSTSGLGAAGLVIVEW